MKSISLVCGLAALFMTSSIFAGSIQVNFVEQMSKQIEYAEKHQVWPGFHPASTPSIFILDTNKKPNAYAINFKPGNLPWVKLSSQVTPIYYLEDISLLNLDDDANDTMQFIDNQQSYIHFRTSKVIEREENISNKYMMGRFDYFLKHEAAIDTVHFDYANMTYDRFNDPQIIKLTYLEDAALTFAEQKNTNKSLNAIRDAVAIHQYRNQLLSSDELYFENHHMYFTGIPYFIGWTTRNLTDDDYGKMIQRTGCYPLNSLGGPMMFQDCSARGLPALASAAYGKMLDQQFNNPSWKNEAITQFKSIPQMAIDHFHFKNEEAKQIARLAMKNPDYHWERITRIVDHTMTPYLHFMNNAIGEYQNMPGVTVHTIFGLGVGILMLKNFQDDIYSQIFITNNKTMILTDINLTSKSDDGDPDNDWLFNHLPYLSIHFEINKLEIDLDKSHTDFKINNDASIIINHIQTTAAELIRRKQKQSFDQIRLVDSNIILSFKEPGYIDASDGSLTIRLDSPETKSKSISLFNPRNYYQFKSILNHSQPTLPKGAAHTFWRLALPAMFFRLGEDQQEIPFFYPSH